MNSLTPWHESSGYTWEGIKWNTGQAAQATLDGIIPFWDPFGDNGGYDKCDKALAWSRTLGAFSRDVYLIGRIPNIGQWAKDPLMYETGSLTMPADVYELMEGLNAIQKGKYLVSTFGYKELPGLVYEAAKTGQFAKTIGTGLTPLGWLGVIGAGQAVDTWPQLPKETISWLTTWPSTLLP
jgi:hypothetical protein